MGYIGQIVCITLEIGLPCYYGERVRTSYEDLAQAIYKLKWYEQDIRFQRVFILFLKRAQKDTCLMAGGYIPITLRSFLGVTTILSLSIKLLSIFYSISRFRGSSTLSLLCFKIRCDCLKIADIHARSLQTTLCFRPINLLYIKLALAH